MLDIKRKAVILGVTGGIACGKSEVGRILEEFGFSVCDADHVAHGLMVKGSSVYNRIVGHFGNGILSGNGEISRPVLGQIVFGNPVHRRSLNRLVHPAVRELLGKWIIERRVGEEYGAVLLPLLFESGMESLDWDGIICVSSSEPLVFDRLAQRGIGLQDARRRVESQMPLVDKERLSDYVIHNSGTLQELKEATRKIVDGLVR